MNDWLTVAGVVPMLPETLLAAAAGAVLGFFYFGGLWWTVRRAAASPQPALWFFGSLLLRMAVALPGFWFAGGGHWARLLACLLGFVAARTLLARWTRRAGARHAA